ncbi:hypothetical protein LFT48_15650 [Arthrobacter sp. FW305-123]|nr:hypothetical protein LFT48_15650 [Arthrobacter sp. FW305-123]
MEFDAHAADRLVAACRDAARTLQDQRGRREFASTAALTEFRGVFADCFHENVASERAARSELVHTLEDVARQVQEAKSTAEVEQRRLDDVAEWALASGWARAGGGFGVDEFEQHYYRGPDDDKVNGAINSVVEGNILMENHNLIASNSKDNRRVLDEVSEVLKR